MEFARTSPKSLKLILTARRIDTLKDIAEQINKEVGSGVQVLPVKLDISKPSEVKSFVESLPTEFKEIDVLVNNAYVLSVYIKSCRIALANSMSITGVLSKAQQKRRIY